MNSLRDAPPATLGARPGLSEDSFLRPSSILPLEASLKQLLRSEACSDEAFFDYELAQALRGLAHAVKSNSSIPVSAATADQLQQSAGTLSGQRMRGSDLALWRLAHACVASEADVNTAIYLSTRLLCDGASAYGDGNDRPCCTREWTDAFLALADESVWASPAASAAARFLCPSTSAATPSVGVDGGTSPSQALIARACVDRRLQLGYLVLLAGTTRMIACAHVPGKHLLLDYPALVQGIIERVLPGVALLAGGADADDRSRGGEEAPLPSRLHVEANQFLVQIFYWIAMDTLASHEALGKEKDRGDASRRSAAPRMLDRDVPQCLWPQLRLFRRALVRCLTWCAEDAARACGPAPATAAAASSPSAEAAHANMSTLTALVQEVFAALLKTHEKLSHARLAVARQYGESAKDYYALSDALWSSTLRLCVVVRDVAGAFTSVQGGLAVGATSTAVVLQTNRDVLLHAASCVLRVPALQKKETDVDILSATSALLSAAVCVTAAAPVLSLQSSLWGADVDVTRQIHASLVQRALHYRDETVLKLASFVSSSLVYALAPSASTIASSIAADSSEQLLDMLAESRDAASQCAIDMLTRTVTERPHALLPALFRLLHHGSSQARRNALEVLAGLPRQCVPDALDAGPPVASGEAALTRAPRATAAMAAKHRETLRLLAENLLLHLQDEELCLRLQSAALFEKVWPEDVLRPLLTLSVTHDPTGRKQAAAAQALQSVFSAHSSDADVVLLLLKEALSLLEDATVTSVPQARRRPSSVSDTSTPADGHGVSQAARAASPHGAPLPTYATPADILSRALLYSTEPLTTELAGEDHGEDALTNGGHGAGNEATTQNPQTIAEREKAKFIRLRDRLASVVTKCALIWARHIRTPWSASAHLCPLLSMLKSVATGDAADGTVSGKGEASRGAEHPHASMRTLPEESEGFLWRCLTSLVVSVSHPAFEGPPGAAAALLESVCTVFLDDGTGDARDDRSQPACTPPLAPWLAHVDSWARLEQDKKTAVGPTPSEQLCRHRLLTSTVLAPLLFLRACHETVMAALTVHVLGDASTGNEDGDARHSRCLKRLWRTLWTVLTEEPYRAGFDAVPEAQRVLLEVITHFPSETFFATLQTVYTGADTETLPTKSQRLFAARLFVFGLCSYLTRPSCDLDLSASSVHLRYLDTLVNETVLPWMCTGASSCVVGKPMSQPAEPRESSTPAQDNNQLQRLTLSVVDAYALVETVRLARTDPSSVGVKDSANVTDSWALGSVLHTLAAIYRESKAQEKGRGSGTDKDAATSPVAHSMTSDLVQAWLTQLQLCVLVQRRVLELLQRQAATGLSAGSMEATAASTSAAYYVRWCEAYFPGLIELANAAAAGTASSSQPASVLRREAEEVCVQCTDLMFFAVMASRGFGARGRTASTAAESATAISSSSSPSTGKVPLQQLSYSDKEALLQFAIGTTRYHKSPAIQHSGVKLLSALLGVAPDLFAEIGDSHAGGNRLSLLEDGAQALYSVSLMHPDGQTRRTAEQVLRLLSGATSAAGQSSSRPGL